MMAVESGTSIKYAYNSVGFFDQLKDLSAYLDREVPKLIDDLKAPHKRNKTDGHIDNWAFDLREQKDFVLAVHDDCIQDCEQFANFVNTTESEIQSINEQVDDLTNHYTKRGMRPLIVEPQSMFAPSATSSTSKESFSVSAKSHKYETIGSCYDDVNITTEVISGSLSAKKRSKSLAEKVTPVSDFKEYSIQRAFADPSSVLLPHSATKSVKRLPADALKQPVYARLNFDAFGSSPITPECLKDYGKKPAYRF